MDTLIEILEQTVKKNGEKPLTNLWLLNILKLADERQLLDEHHTYSLGCTVEMESDFDS